jgi:anti-anti-sigma regulatory factor
MRALIARGERTIMVQIGVTPPRSLERQMKASLVFDGCPDPLAIVVGDVVQEQNPAWQATVGTTSSLTGCFAPEDHDAIRRALAEASSGRASLMAKLAVGPHRGASTRCALWSAGGEARCLRLDGPALAAPGDIVRSKDRALLWIFDHIEAALWTTLRDGTIALSEGSGLAHFGVRPGQIVGSNVFQLFPADSHSVKTMRRVLAGEVVRDAYAEDQVYWLSHCHPLRGEDGEVFAQISLAIAMTDNAKELHYAQSLLHIVNELPLVVWAMTSDGKCTLSAGKGLMQLGFVPGQLVGTNLYELYAGHPEITADYKRVLAGEVLTTETPVGDSIWRTTYHPARDRKGTVTGLFAVSQDISAQTRDAQRIREQLALIQEQKRAIDRLVSPIIEVWRGVLVVPLIGDIGAERAAIVTERLLDGVVRRAARFAILDLTGIARVDTSTAAHLFAIMRGVALLGCTPLVSGIRPSVAATMVELGMDVPTGRTYSTLAEALRRCMRAADAPRG